MDRRILLVEDEPGLVMTLTDRLHAEGYRVDSAPDGNSGFSRALAESFDLVLLDWMLPGKNGLEVCRELREAGCRTPILMLTARNQIVDKVIGLQIGADDYLTKPFDMRELCARISALLRRTAKASNGSQVIIFGNVRVDLNRAEVCKSGVPVAISAREYQLLRYLIDHRGEVISREDLLNDVWGYQSSIPTRTVDVHMAWLRQKLEENPKYPRYLLTVRGFGYRLDI